MSSIEDLLNQYQNSATNQAKVYTTEKDDTGKEVEVYQKSYTMDYVTDTKVKTDSVSNKPHIYYE